MVQRYIEGGYGASEMEEDVQGDWVKHDDYSALEGVVKALLADVKRRNPGQDLYCPFMRQLERLTK